ATEVAPTEAAPTGAEEEPEAEPEMPPPAPTLPPAQGNAAVGAVPLFPEPGQDATALKKQGEERPGAKAAGDGAFAEDWWSHARPVLELHGYLRVRAELFHHFSLGRVDLPADAMWPRPADDSYIAINQNRVGPKLCTPDEVDSGSSDSPEDADQPCK